MSLLARAKADILAITSDSNGWGTALEFTKADGSLTVTVTGIATSHHLTVDIYGAAQAGRQVHISVSEAALLALEFATRNNAGQLILNGCVVKWTDAGGIEKTYTISEAHPDNTIGLIVCKLKDKE